MKVEWANMDHKAITAAGLMPKVMAHIESMDKYDADVYRVYLRDWCGFPKEFAPELLPIFRPSSK